MAERFCPLRLFCSESAVGAVIVLRYPVVGDSIDAVDGARQAEIHDHTMPETETTQIREYLLFEDRRVAFGALDLDHHQVVHEEIEAIAAVVRALLEADGDHELALDDVAACEELVGDDGLVRGFEQTGAEFPMHLDGHVEHVIHDRVRCEHATHILRGRHPAVSAWPSMLAPAQWWRARAERMA